MSGAPTILVDADACPVKDEIYRVAWRHEVPVKVVSNSRLRVPDHPLIERITVSGGFDAADDWIAAEADALSIVVTRPFIHSLKSPSTSLGPGTCRSDTISASRSA